MSPPDLLFTDAHHIHDGGFFGVWMQGDVMGIRIVGELNDERNPVWRAEVDALWERHRVPRFIALDVSEAIPAASLAKRMQTALWGRRVLSRIEWGAIRVTENVELGLTVRAILRIAGMSNVTLAGERETFREVVAGFLRGEMPS